MPRTRQAMAGRLFSPLFFDNLLCSSLKLPKERGERPQGGGWATSISGGTGGGEGWWSCLGFGISSIDSKAMDSQVSGKAD